MRPSLLALSVTLGLGACSWTFDNEAPELPLVGPEPATFSLPKLNDKPAGRVDMRYGADGKLWVSWTELELPDPDGTLHKQTRRALRLDDPTKEELFFVDELTIGSPAYYTYQHEKADMATGSIGSTTVHMHKLGDNPAHDREVKLSGERGFLTQVRGDDELLWWPADKSTTEMQVFRVDGTYARTIPLPMDVDSVSPPGKLSLIFVQGGTILMTRGPDGELKRWTLQPPPTTNPPPVLRTDGSLGMRPPPSAIDEAAKAFLTCSDDGLRAVYYDGSPDKLYDGDACTTIVTFAGRTVYYRAQNQWRTIPLDGNNDHDVIDIPGLQRILGFGAHAELLYSTDGPDTYIEGAGNGWYRGWNFMERGVDAVISRDGKKMHWIEHAAKLGAVGDCLWAPVPDEGAAAPTPTRLARNCAGYEGQSDGRVILFEDAAFRGEFNRLVIADEEAKEKRWIAKGAEDYLHIPGTTDLLLIRYSPIGNDIVRVSVPARAAMDMGL